MTSQCYADPYRPSRVVDQAVAANTVRSPPPCGEGLGVGVAVGGRISCTNNDPPPPQGGREQTESAAPASLYAGE